ncbi:MAG TPA: GTPase HflX [Planctomycetes bacterium]|nr:GTPase HflX [Planctomycetota bacterium]
MSRPSSPTGNPAERFLVCGALLPGQTDESAGALAEARSLVEAAGAEVVGADEEGLVQRRQRPHPSTFLGKGKVEEIRELVRRLKPDAVLVDNDLSPAQGRNLESALGVRIVDRSELILDIFACRARTHQARLQVELAQMEYLRPRLRRMWTHLERTEGAVGTRGPGETQLETDRRLIAKRIRDLKARLSGIEGRKRRQVGSRSDDFTVGLVGYTNAGKSTLLNRLTGSSEFVADMPFATLDTRTRKWTLPDGRVVLLSDTVGFLSRLPHHLVASFHATLEEALSVDLLLHVVDAAHPDALDQMNAVDETLASISHRRVDLVVFNKVDLVADPIQLQLLRNAESAPSVQLSAHTGAGIPELEALVASHLDRRSVHVEARLHVSEGKAASDLRAASIVLSEGMDGDEELVLELRLLEGRFGALERALDSAVRFRVLAPAEEPYRSDGLTA